MKDKVKILDCTERWRVLQRLEFFTLLVEKYLRAMEYSGVDIVELGFGLKPKLKKWVLMPSPPKDF